MQGTEAERVRDRRGSATFVCCIVILVEGVLMLMLSGQGGTTSRKPSSTVASSIQPKSSELSQDELRQQAMQGVWEDNYKGRRILTLKDDGTGVMIVEPEGLAAFTYAPKLTFQERWSVGDGTVRMDATGGQPAFAVQMILKLYGSSATFRIEDVTGGRMVLIDLADGTRFEWRRVEAAKQ